MIRVDTIWLAIKPLDMWARTETALVRVVAVINDAVFLWRSASVTFAGAAWCSNPFGTPPQQHVTMTRLKAY